MLLIIKNSEPRSLSEYKKTKFAYYDGCNKVDIRASLMIEQGYLCAYCMSRISGSEESTIEHYLPQSGDSEEIAHSLEYKNMLAVCNGNKGKPYPKQTCGEHRKNIALTVNPLDIRSIEKICYTDNGRIYSDDERINKDLDETLNLNSTYSYHQANRAAAWRQVKNLILQNNGRVWNSGRELERYKSAFEQVDADGMLIPYSGIILYFLNKRIKKLRIVMPDKK